tara:strand:+ start:6722 stop:6922 length:201 start_codon:yes stop_codon:yes gene_type:complete
MELTNDTLEDEFLYQMDLSIETGNILYIKNAIEKYKKVLSKFYIDWANEIIIQLVTENIDEIVIEN